MQKGWPGFPARGSSEEWMGRFSSSDPHRMDGTQATLQPTKSHSCDIQYFTKSNDYCSLKPGGKNSELNTLRNLKPILWRDTVSVKAEVHLVGSGKAYLHLPSSTAFLLPGVYTRET